MDIFHKTIEGVSHKESKKPCQDYSLSVDIAKNIGDKIKPIIKRAVIGIVCDGHGADKHFRSQVGSMLACKIAIEKLKLFFEAYPTHKQVSCGDLKQKYDRLKLSIISVWQSKIEEWTRGEYKEVEGDLVATLPKGQFTEDELKKTSETFRQRQGFDVSIPYGTTLLAALLCEDYCLLLMIGDGAIVKFFPNGQGNVVQFDDKNVFDDEPHSAVDSLCDEKCFSNLHCTLFAYEGSIGLGLCTDGLSEAVGSDKVLIDRFSIYANFLADNSSTKEAREKAEAQIEDQLNEVSKRSVMKDDISVSIITNNLKAFESSPQEMNIKGDVKK